MDFRFKVFFSVDDDESFLEDDDEFLIGVAEDEDVFLWEPLTFAIPAMEVVDPGISSFPFPYFFLINGTAVDGTDSLKV